MIADKFKQMLLNGFWITASSLTSIVIVLWSLTPLFIYEFFDFGTEICDNADNCYVDYTVDIGGPIFAYCLFPILLLLTMLGLVSLQALTWNPIGRLGIGTSWIVAGALTCYLCVWGHHLKEQLGGPWTLPQWAGSTFLIIPFLGLLGAQAIRKRIHTR